MAADEAEELLAGAGAGRRAKGAGRRGWQGQSTGSRMGPLETLVPIRGGFAKKPTIGGVLPTLSVPARASVIITSSAVMKPHRAG